MQENQKLIQKLFIFTVGLLLLKHPLWTIHNIKTQIKANITTLIVLCIHRIILQTFRKRIPIKIQFTIETFPCPKNFKVITKKKAKELENLKKAFSYLNYMEILSKSKKKGSDFTSLIELFRIWFKMLFNGIIIKYSSTQTYKYMIEDQIERATQMKHQIILNQHIPQWGTTQLYNFDIKSWRSIVN